MSTDTEKWLVEHKIDEVEAIVPDIAGVARGKFFPASKFLKHKLRMPESIFVQGITGDYGDVGDRYEIDADLVLMPDFNTMRAMPWGCRADGGRDRRLLSKNMEPLAHARRAGAQTNPGFVRRKGLEARLRRKSVLSGAANKDPDYPLEAPIGRAGRKEGAGRSYSIDAVNEFDPIIEDIYDYCEAMEVDADSLSHEDGAGQLEVNFLHGDPLELADQVFLFKRIAREAALKHGIFATFMAKSDTDLGATMKAVGIVK
jgi:glutamine synthetase